MKCCVKNSCFKEKWQKILVQDNNVVQMPSWELKLSTSTRTARIDVVFLFRCWFYEVNKHEKWLPSQENWHLGQKGLNVLFIGFTLKRRQITVSFVALKELSFSTQTLKRSILSLLWANLLLLTNLAKHSFNRIIFV